MDIDCVLLLEDEPFIAMDPKDLLKSAGVKTVDVIDTTTKAEELLADHIPNIAIIDYRLGTERRRPHVADRSRFDCRG